MPRAKRVPSSPARREQEFLWASISGGPPELTVRDWDPRTDVLVQALLEVLDTGACVFLRPGNGRQSLGIAIWEGDQRHPATWFSEHEELDVWARQVVEQAEEYRSRLDITGK